MDITIKEDDGDTLAFNLDGVSVEMANALRRTMMGDVPTLAIEEITVTANNSGLYDEILAHRLGMVPWTFDPEDHELPEECDCEDGCHRCEISMALQAEGPGTVTADDIAVPADNVEPAKPDTKVVDLKEDGELDIEMTAQLGLGKDHAKWQAANASYAYEDGTFHVDVESVSGLDPRTIVSRAVDRIDDRLDAFEDAVQEDL